MLPDQKIWVLDVDKSRSSIIRKISFDEDKSILTVKLTYATYYYAGVSFKDFEDLCNSKSMGRHFNSFIKPNFTQIKPSFMAEEKKKVPTKNKASDKKRFIDFSINVREIKREWIVPGEKGDYLNCRFVMLEDGKVDVNGQLGYIFQAVPIELYKKAEAEQPGTGKSIKGPLLGGAKEFDWGGGNHEGDVSNTMNAALPEKPLDDLPF